MLIEMKKDEKKIDNWLYLIKQRARKENAKDNRNNQEMKST
jgi:hypothetical protein